MFGDSRGYFLETYSEKDFFEAGDQKKNLYKTVNLNLTKNVLRGFHYQKKYCQAKLVRVLEGEVFDVAVDLRNDSPTFGKYYGVLLTGRK
ncbi:dTDP-4-dehydrorhamnose 3,5-epimerase [Brachyspira hyodysenteriae]|uniref:dTDP-4-dehydrorhamnose 3,5-epimerase family protein n=1 Tax=Brachyspira hyodysenteriae TaxID=159 RepID=UPI0022CE215C|nr:dTDP-4-dehydrorhamnose 3,5-epimerase [Brachyspira hyodysenteriae]